MSASAYHPLTQMLYLAYFGRPADPGALALFSQRLADQGLPTDVAALSRKAMAPDQAGLSALIDSFGASGESHTLYGASSTAGFVDAVYRNLFDRPAKQAGLDYWSAQLDGGRITRGQAALQILAGAYLNTSDPLQAALDRAAVANKVEVASWFTGLLDTPAKRDAYRGPDAARDLREMLGWVDHGSDPAAFRPTVERVLGQLLGEEPAGGTPIQLDDNTAYLGSDAPEQLVVGATVRSVHAGGGDDVVTLTAPALGSGGSLDGGAGTDTLVLTAAHAAEASAGLAAAIAGFERLELLSVSSGAVDLDRLDGIAHVTLSSPTRYAIDGALVDNLPSGATVAVNTDASAFKVNVKHAASGASDVLNLSASGDSGVDMGSIGAPAVETVHFHTLNTYAVRLGTVHSAKLDAPDATAITVRGNAGLSLSFTGTALRSFDGSGESGDLSWTSGALAFAALIKTGAGNNRIDFSAATGTVEFIGGSGADDVQANHADNQIKTGFGDDLVTLGSGANSVNLGHGHDEVSIVRGGANLISGGEGVDTYILAGAGSRSGSVFSTIVDFELSERIRFSGAEQFLAQDQLGGAIQLGQGAALRQFLDAAAAGTRGGELHWFVHDGATWLVHDASASATFQDGVDQLIKLSGVFDLSEASFSLDGVFWGMSM